MRALAVDIGGTKLAAGLVEEDGRLLATVLDGTGPVAEPEPLWQALCLLLDRLLLEGDGLPIAGVGVGCGGPMRWPAGEVSPLNIPGWRGFALRQRLQDRFPGLPVRVHNDAVCVAVAEHWLGVGRDHDNLLGMVISTGVGGGLILAGHLVDGGTGNAGHVGHIVVEPAGPRCACGGRGCLEAIARGPAIIAWALDHGWRPTGPPTGQQLAGDAAAGDPTATAALERAGRAVGIAIASAANLCDFDAVAVAGGVSNAGRLLFDPMRAAFREHAGMDFVRRTRIEPAFLGPGAGLYGAAALVLQGDRYWSAD